MQTWHAYSLWLTVHTEVHVTAQLHCSDCITFQTCMCNCKPAPQQHLRKPKEADHDVGTIPQFKAFSMALQVPYGFVAWLGGFSVHYSHSNRELSLWNTQHATCYGNMLQMSTHTDPISLTCFTWPLLQAAAQWLHPGLTDIDLMQSQQHASRAPIRIKYTCMHAAEYLSGDNYNSSIC